MGGQVDALAKLAHHCITRQSDAKRLGQLLARRLQALWRGKVTQSVITQLQQRGGADLLDAFEGVGNRRRRIAHFAGFGQPGTRTGEIARPSSLFGTADQPALGCGQALPCAAVVFIQRQRFTEVADGTVAILTDTVRAQVLLASTVVGHHPLRQLHPRLQRTHFLILRRQGQQHQCLAAGLGQRLALLQRPHQQGIGQLLQSLAGTLQAQPGLAVIRVFFLHRQPQRNGGIRIFIEPAFSERLLGGAPQLGQAAALAVHPWRRPLLYVLGGIFTGDGHAALPGLRTGIGAGVGALGRARLFAGGPFRRRGRRRRAAGQGHGQGGAQHGRQRKTQAEPPSAQTRTDVRLFSPA